MIVHIITLTVLLIKSSKCSEIIDAQSQDTIYVSEYCPRQKYCRDGTHVMCMYYDHDHEFGPRCGNPVRAEVTPKMVEAILQNVNNIRGKLSSGVERGKDDVVLPRAYGMMKIEWDRELATLAQVLANQCLGGREDICRSTDKFPNPSQSIAIVHFKYPNWEYIRLNNTEKGLNEEKLTFAMDRFLKSAHVLKRTVTKDIIMECPAFNDLPDLNSKYYLNLIRGGATHIGCGVSAYSKYKIDGQTESVQNSVQVVCNISDGPQPGEPLYNTEPPLPGLGFTKRCGCPQGSKETRNCLCERTSDDWTSM
ncbi:venom allergen 5 [Spodoptera frugiperda]|uniref:Venom allergen 5 n=2 Tax=Spodoptera frugiperda TaxID=7108 RepID=A0A9R0DVZ4_SPOFR|nr:venom allergen 5 [Spodoptera frugiperda]